MRMKINPMKMDALRAAKITILNHFEATGACEELREWLRNGHADEVVYVAFPFRGSRNSHVQADRYLNGTHPASHRSLLRFRKPEAFAYLRDAVYGLLYGLRFALGSDVLIAGDNLLAAIGVVLRRLRVVKRVVYYMIDFTPVRFQNRLLDAAYRRMDRFSAHQADRVWPLTAQMIQARFERDRLDPERVKWLEVPYGTRPIESAPKKTAPAIPLRIVYLGEITQSKGAPLLVPMAVELRKQGHPCQFHAIGTGDAFQALRQAIHDKAIEDAFVLHGYVEDFDEVIRLLMPCDLAVAPYNTGYANSFTAFADPGKVKTYLGCGLPVVLTDVPPIAQRIETEQAGLIAKCDAKDFAAKIVQIAAPEKYGAFRRNALKLGQQYNWDAIFRKAFAEL
jgi:glycosyltransferase involved in cell wall biosynthesis